MRIKLRTNMAGPKGTTHAGQVVDLPEGQAYDLIERGFAEQADVLLLDGGARRAPQTGVRKARETRKKPDVGQASSKP